MRKRRTHSIGIAVICLWVGTTATAGPQAIPLAADAPSSEVSAEGVWRGTGTGGQTTTSLVATVTAPKIGKDHYAVIGDIRYDDIEGSGQLVMWNDFDGASYFTKTVEEQGPLQFIRGTSEWRRFALPFSKSNHPDPDAIRIELVLPGAGTVMIRDVVLVTGREWMTALNPDAWWPPSNAGLIGAAAGISLGLLGCLVGLSCSRPSWRILAWPCASIMLSVGVICLIASLVAVVHRQPGYVLHILLLIGFIASAVGAHTLWKLNRMRTEDELRKIESKDLVTR